MKKFHYLETIISPNITEKSTSFSDFNKVVFKDDKGANKDSIKKNSAYMTFHVSLSSLFATLLKSGFFPITRSRFRCLHNSTNLMQEIMQKKAHWSLSDSDNDSFD